MEIITVYYSNSRDFVNLIEKEIILIGSASLSFSCTFDFLKKIAVVSFKKSLKEVLTKRFELIENKPVSFLGIKYDFSPLTFVTL